MVVVVVRADRDHRDPRAQHAQEVGEPRVLGSVVGDLQHLDGPEAQPRRDVTLGVGGEEDVDRAVAREGDDGVLVRVLAREPRVVRPEDPQLQLADPEDLARMDDHDRDSAASCLRERRIPVR